jgi:adenylosuccinate synthase
MNYAVIGANWGDEGKGLITDYLAAKEPDSSLVIRFNGGANAGHTVVTPAGLRHVFGHYGSGTLAGARTFLSRHFICNPILCNREFRHLRELLGIAPPLLLVDPACVVTTPWDMMMNQFLEQARGNARHGSCGVGINETVVRSSFPEYRLTVADLANPNLAWQTIERICIEYIPARLRALTIHGPTHHEVIMQGLTPAQFSDECRYFLSIATLIDASKRPPPQHKTLIFEGAQGLCLDRDNAENFPHVTNSKTGIANVVELMNEWKVPDLNVIYCTRTYLSRHGAGPLPDEAPLPVVDLTNQPHDFQGKIRFAPFTDASAVAMIKRIEADFESFGSARGPLIAVTHCDQIQPHRVLRARGCLFSYGPTRMHVHVERGP